ncbi:MAG: lysophospholipid acyltransferase family protein [Verrucomicrobiales bacterium]
MSPTYRICHTIARLVGHLWFQHEVVHRERLMEEGPVLIVCNHVSFLDPPMVGISYRKEIWFLARKSLFRGFGAWLYPRLNVIPVDQEQPDMTGLKNIIRLLQKGESVLLFPEGSRSWDGSPQPGEPGVGLVIAKTRVPVQPLRIFGAHSVMPRGAGLPRLGRIRIVVGHPITFTEEERSAKGRHGYGILSDRVMQAIAALAEPE